MVSYFVLLDACVLYPQTLRDLLLSVASTGLFQARWTERINEEWVEKLLLKNPARRLQVLRTLELVNKSVEDCLITGYEHLIESIVLPDPDDRHVVAAAVAGGVDAIETALAVARFVSGQTGLEVFESVYHFFRLTELPNLC